MYFSGLWYWKWMVVISEIWYNSYTSTVIDLNIFKSYLSQIYIYLFIYVQYQFILKSYAYFRDFLLTSVKIKSVVILKNYADWNFKIKGIQDKFKFVFVELIFALKYIHEQYISDNLYRLIVSLSFNLHCNRDIRKISPRYVEFWKYWGFLINIDWYNYFFQSLC